MRLSLFTKFLLMFILITVPEFANSVTRTPITVLALGDSLTAGYGLDQDKSFPMQLEKGLAAAGYDVRVINAGVSGDTTAGGLARVEWALADRPQIVIVELGANDALRGLDPAQAHANLDQIITRLSQAGCRVILTGMRAPRNLGADYTKRFDSIYPDLASQYDLLFYPFFLEGVATDPALNQGDGIHPNAAGVRQIVKGLQPLVTVAIDELIASKTHK